MSDEVVIDKLWRVRRTIMQMVHDRGYQVVQGELDQTFQQFKETFGDKPSEDHPKRSDLIMSFVHNLNNIDKIVVFFDNNPKVSLKKVKSYCTQMKDKRYQHAILVMQEGMHPAAKMFVQSLAPRLIVEPFLESELVINITKLESMAEHIVLTEKEKSEFLAHYEIKETALMRMQVTDPVARYFGFKPGQVLRINRPSTTPRKQISYRLVC